MSDQTQNFLAIASSASKRPAVNKEELVVAGSVVKLTPPATANFCQIRVFSDVTSGDVLNYLMLGDSIVPTATTGIFLCWGDYFEIDGAENIALFRAIQSNAGNHVLRVQYFK